jgi:aspartyl aminopeptidase
MHDEFLSSPRTDNQVHCFTSVEALVSYAGNQRRVQGDPDISMIALFDHEEVGSESISGACSPVMAEAVARVGGAFAASSIVDQELHMVSLRKSFLVSADVAHAMHPNYASKHEGNHQPKLNRGTVLKTNDNQRYATNAATGFILRELARRASQGVASYEAGPPAATDVPLQEFVVRNDCPCGTTIGPIIAAKTGIRTVDVGVPSLSMHSIRETVGVQDVLTSKQLFEAFFAEFRALDDACAF